MYILHPSGFNFSDTSMGFRTKDLNVSMLFLIFFSLLLSQHCCVQVYNITRSHPLAQGQTLVSPGHIYELGFFSLSNSSNVYVGLWHMDILPRKFVWVANREKPLLVTDTSANLSISSSGNLELVDGKLNSVWSNNVSFHVSVSSSNSSLVAAFLLDDGNFVVKEDVGSDQFIWQSFDYPCDTMLPSQLMGFDSKSGKKNLMTNWKSDNDPSAGIFSVGLSTQIPSQAFVWINGSTPHYRSGPWDKSKFIGVPEMNAQYLSGFTLDDDVKKGTKYFSYNTLFDNISAYAEVSSEGSIRLIYSDNGKNWGLTLKAPKHQCDVYGACGSYGLCKASRSPICNCIKGFIPKSHREWSKGNWTGGCVRKTKLFCESRASKPVSTTGRENNDVFWKMIRSKVPDDHEYITSLGAQDTFDDCKIGCLNNCSCLAYAYVNNIGCLAWFRDLIDIREFPSGGVDLYIRLAHSELGAGKPIKLIVSLSAICLISMLGAIVFGLYRLQDKRKGHIKLTRQRFESGDVIQNSRDTLREYLGKHDQSELLIYDLDSILIATDNFSSTNKLGEGGFGPVYRGKLPDGKDIAVKRLSSSSRQGIEEFKNEMLLISNLQHKNLVKIMGCCVKEDEKLLIYEFMPNKSLDTFLFDTTRKEVLNWARCFSIIQGVARGLLYLHHDSCLKVIHRDLKVSNILLDEEMNPKISDFGLARIVEGNLENTQKVVGTFGYMAPEYAMGGIFSEKSDVYSFGVLVLEIISGKKNTSFYDHDLQLGFLAYAWHLWNEGKGLKLIDGAVADSHCTSEVIRCIHVGLLCVQDDAADRPTMTDVVFMLNSGTDGPQPNRPIFTFKNSVFHPQPQYENTGSTNDEATITVIEGR